MNDELLNQIALSLQIITKLEASKFLVENFTEAPNKEKIAILSRIGFGDDDIATLVGTTTGTVKKELSLMKSSQKGDK